jgi:SAM-dependent methyltransferase
MEKRNDPLMSDRGSESLDIEGFRDHPAIFKDRITQLKFALDSVRSKGLALEFGVYRGKSLRTLAEYRPTQRFIGFDSFIGLPEPWVRSPTSTYEAGHFALKSLPDMPENVQLVAGFFEESLPRWLDAGSEPVSFLHLDCDLYSAAKFVLDTLNGRLSEDAVVVFDELCDWKDSGVYPNWIEGEWRALKEWLEETGRRFRILSRGPQYEAAIQLTRESASMEEADIVRRIKALERFGQRQAAGAFAEEAAEMYPASPHIARIRAELLAREERFEDAVAVISRALDSQPVHYMADEECMFLALYGSRLLMKAGRDREAHDWVVKQHARQPGHVPTAKQLRVTAGKLRLFREGADALSRTLLEEQSEELSRWRDRFESLASIKPDFAGMQFSSLLIQQLVENYEFRTVLDIGSGGGEQARILRRAGKVVTELDYGESIYFEKQEENNDVVIGDFMKADFEEKFDCIILSHVLEHQLNVNAFLRRVSDNLKEGGLLAISVPPLKHDIVGGHLTLWNAGLLIYNLVIAGFNCKNVWVRQYSYNISLIVRKRPIAVTGLAYDSGDIDKIKPYIPDGLGEGFDGDISRIG